MVTKLYNLIILDRSGSMSTIINPTIAGVNETLATIRMAQQKTNIQQYVTLVSFCGCSTTTFCDNASINDVKEFTRKDYQPCCNTPLYDAIGEAVTKLKAQVSKEEDSSVSVTIITDGYENSSTEYTGPKVAKMIEALKEKGWTFNFIGANIDVEKVSATLKIDNTMSWNSDEEGTKEMYSKFRSSYTTHMAEMVNEDADIPLATRIEERKKRSRRFFGK